MICECLHIKKAVRENQTELFASTSVTSCIETLVTSERGSSREGSIALITVGVSLSTCCFLVLLGPKSVL